MFEKVLPGKTKDILALLGESDILPEKTYLAGGTACALQLGHRVSYDLDYFTTNKFSINIVLEKIKNLNHNFILEREAEQTILGSFPEIKFSLFYYPYELLEETVNCNGNNLASLKDIAAMKINAVSDRGTKRDFVDLYFIMQNKNYSLDLVLQFYDEKFSTLSANREHILKSLTYFDDAENSDVPNMLVNYDWQKIKAFFISKAKKYQAELLK